MNRPVLINPDAGRKRSPVVEYARTALGLAEHFIQHRRDEIVRENAEPLLDVLVDEHPGDSVAFAAVMLLRVLANAVDAPNDELRRAWANAAAAVALAVRAELHFREMN